jgi:AraC-like DNA-binding protein
MPDHDALRRGLLDRLIALLPDGTGAAGMRPLGTRLFTYAALQHERLAAVRLDHPLIGIVLSGRKEVWIGQASCTIEPGEIFVFPAGVDADVVNIPSGRRGRYESLLVEVRDRPTRPVQSGLPQTATFDLKVPLSADLADALVHAATSLSAPSMAEALARHRLAEVLLLLEPHPQARSLFASSMADIVAHAIASASPAGRSASAIAHGLGLSVATLRRRLAAEGHSFRQLALQTRMALAHALLLEGRASVAEAAEIAGYASRSHFARSFRRVHGHVPKRTMRRAVRPEPAPSP